MLYVGEFIMIQLQLLNKTQISLILKIKYKFFSNNKLSNEYFLQKHKLH